MANTSYKTVKENWSNDSARPIKSSGVESWKAAFEEFGLLYVLSGTDQIVVTPGGKQLIKAYEDSDRREFAWVGLNLLLRYPLRGKTERQSYGSEFDNSDLLLYWFIFAALIELEGF